MAARNKGPHTPKVMPGHVSSNRKPGMHKADYSGPKTTKPNFSPKVHGNRHVNHSAPSRSGRSKKY